MNYFSEDELRCQCGCGVYFFDDDALSILNNIRSDCGFPLPVSSGYRCLEHPLEKHKAHIGAHSTGKAVDLAAVVDGQVRWDWPLYSKLATAMKRAAEILNVKIEWGGDWVTFKDGPHFQLKD